MAYKTVVTAVTAFLSWIVTFGAPVYALADGGSEFDNELFRFMRDRFGITLDSTAAQAPWSYGMCERHNAVMNCTLAKIREDAPDARAERLLDLACLAKNILLVHGSATPHQLKCGSQPLLASTLTDSPAALSDVRIPGDDTLQLTRRILCRSRVAFVAAEADRSLRRALALKTRSPGVTCTRDTEVYYGHTGVSISASGWRGPARVVGQVVRQVLLRHGGK